MAPRVVKFPKHVPHVFRGDTPEAQFTGRPVCQGCGLALLRNLLTDWCRGKGCEYQEHPGYREALRELPRAHRRATAGRDW